MRIVIRISIFFMLSGMSLMACKQDFLDDVPPAVPVAPRSAMMDYLKYNYNFSMFYQALLKTGIAATLSDTSKQYTLMAPDNDAFAAAGISAESLNNMDGNALKQLISYHILPGLLPEEAIAAALNTKYFSIDNQALYISKQAQSNIVTVNALTLKRFGTTSDIKVANGIIHVLPASLKPPQTSVKSILTNDPRFSRFTSALQKFGLLEELDNQGPYVVLAISDDYFMDETTLAEIDTVHYKKYLFDVYLLRDRFFFMNDFNMRPPSTEYIKPTQYYLNREGCLVFRLNDEMLYAVPLGVGPNPDYYSWGLGDVSYFTSLGAATLAKNGVVMELNETLVYPDAMKK